MTKEEINRTIAEYMGFTVYPADTELMPQCMSHIRIDNVRYTDSVDACLPVAEKLKAEKPLSCWVNLATASYCVANILIFNMVPKYKQASSKWGDMEIEIKDKSPSLALSTALAQAIKELGND